MARDRAAKADRRYPNLVDNMAVLKLRKVMGDSLSVWLNYGL
jgi:hypothetical protein